MAPVITNSLIFCNNNLYFYSKKREAASRQTPQVCWLHLSPSCQKFGFKVLLKSRQLQLEPLGLISWALATQLLNIHSGVCFSSCCFWKRTSGGSQGLLADVDVKTSQVKLPIHCKTESSSRNCNRNNSNAAGDWKSLEGEHKIWWRTNAFGCPGLAGWALP